MLSLPLYFFLLLVTSFDYFSPLWYLVAGYLCPDALSLVTSFGGVSILFLPLSRTSQSDHCLLVLHFNPSSLSLPALEKLSLLLWDLLGFGPSPCWTSPLFALSKFFWSSWCLFVYLVFFGPCRFRLLLRSSWIKLHQPKPFSLTEASRGIP